MSVSFLHRRALSCLAPGFPVMRRMLHEVERKLQSSRLIREHISMG